MTIRKPARPASSDFATSSATPAKPAAKPVPDLDLDAYLLPSLELDTRRGDAQLQPPSPDDRSALRSRPPETVPGLFARRSINLLIGSIAAGKTALALSQLENYAQAGTFLEHALPDTARPEQIGAVVAVKSLDSLTRQIHAMSLTALSSLIHFPIREWRPGAGETTLDCLTRTHQELSAGALRPVRFLLIEGIQMLMESASKINDPKAVHEFYSALQQFCLDQDCTILGTVSSAKLRRGESFPLLGERIFGSVAWGNEANTLIGIEQPRLDLPEERRPTYRRVVVQYPQEASRTLWADFDKQGKLEVVELQRKDSESEAFAHLDSLLQAAPAGKEWPRSELLLWGEDFGISERTVDRWIASRSDLQMGMLEKVGGIRTKGYRKPVVQ